MHPNDTGTLAIGKLFADSVTSALLDMGTQDGGAPLEAGVGGSRRRRRRWGLQVRLGRERQRPRALRRYWARAVQLA